MPGPFRHRGGTTGGPKQLEVDHGCSTEQRDSWRLARVWCEERTVPPVLLASRVVLTLRCPISVLLRTAGRSYGKSFPVSFGISTQLDNPWFRWASPPPDRSTEPPLPRTALLRTGRSEAPPSGIGSHNMQDCCSRGSLATMERQRMTA